MKPPLIFKGDVDFVYASGVVRGLENYILTRGDYQKIMDSEVGQLPTVLSEVGYGGGEHDPESAFDLATEHLLALAEKLAGTTQIPEILRTGYDFQNASAYLKWRWFIRDEERGEFEQFLPWGKYDSAQLVDEIERLFAGERSRLPESLQAGILRARELADSYHTPLAVDVALDGAYHRYVRESLPEGEYFDRWFAVFADWLNVKSFLRVVALGVNHKLFWEGFVEGGDIPRSKFKQAAEMDKESIPTVFSYTEYGSKLADVVRDSLTGKFAPLDVYFRTQLMNLYRYTRYCIYGIELVWAYIMTRREEIDTLRVIVRAKMANLPVELIREVISVVLE